MSDNEQSPQRVRITLTGQRTDGTRFEQRCSAKAGDRFEVGEDGYLVCVDTLGITERGCVMSEQPKLELFLFVWTQFCPDYSNGLAFAIAETVEQAQKLIEHKRGYRPTDWGPVQVFPATGPIAFCVSGGM